MFARQALLPEGLAWDVLLELASDGTIERIVPKSSPRDAEQLSGAVLPGMANLHSHAFQRAMAGSAERRESSDDDFWSWRHAMYAIAETLDTDTLHDIARNAYRAMVLAGYTAVAEFHYIHRDPSGAWHAERAANALALVAAAREAGIAICLLPALYAHADVGGVALRPEQRRFAGTVDDVLEIAAAVRAAYAHDGDVTVGACAHSLRAATPEQLRALVDGAPPDVPIHLHIAEQTREVHAFAAVFKQRPVAWLLENYAVDGRWCLVHATQVDQRERNGLAASGAVVGLCPTTEANLGDGVFPFGPYLRDNGCFGIGSDSNVSISPVEELRWLEYGQRLITRRRIVAAANDGASCGEVLYSRAARGGAQACGRASGALAVGRRADLIVLHESDEDCTPAVLDRYIFATDRAAPRHVMVGGRWRVRDGALV
ncbi:MAG: formimidoylglutamate deiminase [Candidatus Eremiobacteraeota bacterium]|nr:formimidoylglutamate deiminase [Candidatus Eremiobacteraeota bacterium]MBC5803577.1 formimidoylglutamate deiminase [Candidatus Eremiobacteraeota bacterium]